MPPQLSKPTLRECGQTAREEYGPDLHGLCREACELVGNLLIESGLPAARDVYSVRHVRVGPCGEERHFIVTIPGRYVTGVRTTETVYVDPTLTQFCAENAADGRVDVALGQESDLPPVVVATPGDTERAYYKSPLACRGQALTPETLTLAHKAELTDLLARVLTEDDTGIRRTFRISARTELTLTDCSSDDRPAPAVELRLAAAKSSLPTPLYGDTPDQMDNHLRGLHDDIRDALATIDAAQSTFTVDWTPTHVTRTDRAFRATISRQLNQ